MKTINCSIVLGLLLGWAADVSAAGTRPIQYEVGFKGECIATQTVSIVQTDGLTTISTSFEAELPVFVVLHRYSEQLSATFRADGTVERLGVLLVDGGSRTRLSGSLQAQGDLQIVRTDWSGISTSLIARADYDFNSLVLYGTPPEQFLPTNQPARILSIAQGRVIPTRIQTISENETFERQHLASMHLVWTEGIHTSHSWHPERFSDLPRRYLRQTESGEFTFTLLR